MLQRLQLIHSKMQNSRKVSLRFGCMNPKESKPSFWFNMTDICYNVRSLWFQLLPHNWYIIDLMQTHHQSHLTFLVISNFDRHCTEESVYMWGFFMKPNGSFWKGSNQPINPNADFLPIFMVVHELVSIYHYKVGWSENDFYQGDEGGWFELKLHRHRQKPCLEENRRKLSGEKSIHWHVMT